MSRRLWLLLIGSFGLVVGVAVLLVVRPFDSRPDANPLPTIASLSAPATLAAPEGQSPDAPAGAEVAEATPNGEAGSYVVEDGDTLWTIAVNHDIPLQALIAANPHVNPNLLVPGEVLSLPDPNVPIQATLASPGASNPAISLTGTVATTDGRGLRLRSAPEVNEDNVVAVLEASSGLSIVGRTADTLWLEVVTGAGEGWVMSQWVAVTEALSSLPVTAETSSAAPSSPSAAVTPATSIAQRGSYPDSTHPYISGVTDTSRQIFVRGQSLGNRANVFSKIGDSITDNSVFLEPIGLGEYDLRGYPELAPVVDYFSQAVARDHNSFANTSLAAKGGWSTWNVTNPDSADPDFCLPGETPLDCEYRLVRPSVALIMLGTNDVLTRDPEVYESWMRDIVETSIQQGVIPVLSTIPAFHGEEAKGRVESINGIIIRLAQEYDIPLWDYWSAIQYLPNNGLSLDGIHPSWAVPADFTPENLQYGMTVRNLTALQALDAVWRGAMG